MGSWISWFCFKFLRTLFNIFLEWINIEKVRLETNEIEDTFLWEIFIKEVKNFNYEWEWFIWSQRRIFFWSKMKINTYFVPLCFIYLYLNTCSSSMKIKSFKYINIIKIDSRDLIHSLNLKLFSYSTTDLNPNI